MTDEIKDEPDNMDLSKIAIRNYIKSQFVLKEINDLQGLAVVSTLLIEFAGLAQVEPEDFEEYLKIIFKSYSKIWNEAKNNSKTQL